MTVSGADTCQGAFRYLRVLWQCSSGNTQARVNNKNANIMFSATSNRANPLPLHNQNGIAGSEVYIFVDPPQGIQQVRFYLDNMGRVFTTETIAPWDFLGGRPWDTIGSRVEDGQHRIVAAITFLDGTNGVVDATFNVRNGANGGAGRALDKDSTAYTDTTETVVTENQIVPWTLFGTTIAGIIVLSVIIRLMDRKKAHMHERA